MPIGGAILAAMMTAKSEMPLCEEGKDIRPCMMAIPIVVNEKGERHLPMDPTKFDCVCFLKNPAICKCFEMEQKK